MTDTYDVVAIPPAPSQRSPARSNSGELSVQPSHPSRGRLRLEAQRRSAAFHLSEYLDLRRGIWSDLFEGVATSEDRTLGGDQQALAQDVWRLMVTRDQLRSDLIVLGQILRKFTRNSMKWFGWAATSCLATGLLVPIGNDGHFVRQPSFLKWLFWSMFAISGASGLYSGLGVGFFLLRTTQVKRLQNSIEYDQLREDDRKVLSGWSWNILQFTNAF